MFELFLGITTGLSLIVAGFAVNRDRTAPDASKDFICPYCDNLVTGFKELDLIHHVTCIGKSEADFAAAQKKKTIKQQDEYYKTSQNERHYRFQDGPGWVYRNSFYHRTGVDIYRNGEHIKTVYAGNESTAEVVAKQHIDLDKHQRRHGKV